MNPHGVGKVRECPSTDLTSEKMLLENLTKAYTKYNGLKLALQQGRATIIKQ